MNVLIWVESYRGEHFSRKFSLNGYSLEHNIRPNQIILIVSIVVVQSVIIN